MGCLTEFASARAIGGFSLGSRTKCRVHQDVGAIYMKRQIRIAPTDGRRHESTTGCTRLKILSEETLFPVEKTAGRGEQDESEGS